MAITDAQKIDLLFKKVAYGVSKTDVNANKLAINEAIASPALIRGDTVWNEAEEIPSSIPSANTSYVQVYSDANSGTTIETTEDVTASNNRTWKTGLTNWIPVEFGSSYSVKVYAAPASTSNPQSNGTRLFPQGSGNNDEWYFDYASGVLNFIGTNLPNEIATSTNNVIYISGARYIGTLGVGNLQIQGQLQDNVANAVDADLTATTSDQTIDTFSVDSARTCKYIIQMEHDSDSKYHSSEILLTHNGTEVFFTEYAVVQTQDSSLGEFSATLAGGNVNLTVTPSYTNTSIKAKRLSIDD